MNCVCYNIINNIQRQIANLLSTAAMNRINSDSSSTDDGAYQPNLHLLDNMRQNTSFDLNPFFYITLIFIAFFSFASVLNSRRRRIGGNGSTLN